MPAFSDFFYHPLTSGRTVVEIIRLSEAHNAAIVQEKRRRRVDDVVKRSEYRKAHGLEDQQGFGGWTAKTEAESMGPALPSSEGMEPGARDAHNPQQPRKKWLGII